eukprot:757145-Lingulodinium_polyedra.AAC.1
MKQTRKQDVSARKATGKQASKKEFREVFRRRKTIHQTRMPGLLLACVFPPSSLDCLANQ